MPSTSLCNQPASQQSIKKSLSDSKIVAAFVARKSKLARSAFKVEGYILRLQYEPGELALFPLKYNPYLCNRKGRISQYQSHLNVGNEVRAFGVCVLFVTSASHPASCFAGKRVALDIVAIFVAQEGKLFRRCARVMSSCHFPDCLEAELSSASSMLLVRDPYCSAGRLVV